MGRLDRRWGTCPSIVTTLLLALACAALLATADVCLATDTTPPQVTAFGLSPALVTTQATDQTVTVTLSLTDGESGIRWDDGSGLVVFPIEVELHPGAGTQMVSCRPSLKSGTMSDGTFEGTVTLPAGAATGQWTASVWVMDRIGNGAWISAAELETRFGSGAATVTNTAATADTTPPHVDAFSLTPSTVDTQGADQSVALTCTLSDDWAGVNWWGSPPNLVHGIVEVQLRAQGSMQTARAWPRMDSGTPLVGTYSATFELPRGSTEGGWKAWVGVNDTVGNGRWISPEELETTFGAGAATVTNTATSSDSTPPQVTAFSVTPEEVDTEAGPQTVTASVALTDDQAGVAWEGHGSGLSIIGVQVELLPLIGTQYASCYPALTSGTVLDGVYTGTMTLPAGAKEGIWQACLWVNDRLGNSTWVDVGILSSLPGSSTLVANTAAASQVTIDREWIVETQHTRATFPAGTVVTRQDGGRYAFYQMTGQEFAFDASVPTDDLDGTPIATLKLGIPGLNLSFSKPVTLSFLVGDQYDGFRMQIQSLREDGDTWTDEKTAGVVNGRASVTVTHATRFAASIQKPSISRLGPTGGRRGSTVTITGRSFGKRRGAVKFGSVKCKKVLSWSGTGIRCAVPAAARPGRIKISVTTLAGTSAGKAYTVRR